MRPSSGRCRPRIMPEQRGLAGAVGAEQAGDARGRRRRSAPSSAVVGAPALHHGRARITGSTGPSTAVRRSWPGRLDGVVRGIAADAGASDACWRWRQAHDATSRMSQPDEAPVLRGHRRLRAGPGPGHAAGRRHDRRRLGQAPGRRGVVVERGHALQHAARPAGQAVQGGRARRPAASRSSSPPSPCPTASRWATRACGPRW